MTLITDNGDQIPSLKIVEYLETSMARDLLSKFPDNSAFDFDYTQSSIWSPLAPRPVQPLFNGLELSNNLSFDKSEDVGFLENTKKMAAGMKRKFTDCVTVHQYNKMKKKSMRRSSFGSSNKLISASPTPNKAWNKFVKAASKHFKKKNNNKKKKDISYAHSDLYNYVMEEGNM